MKMSKLAVGAVRHGPIVLQIIGLAAVAFGVGVVLGIGYGIITMGIEAVVTGTLAESPRPAPKRDA